MTFDEYKQIILLFNKILKFPPDTEQAFKTHYMLITLKIKDVETFKHCLNKHLEKSADFPTHIDLYKHLLRELPPINAESVLDKKDDYHCTIRNILAEKYAVSLPSVLGPVYRERLTTQTAQWVKQISYAVEKLKKDYENFNIKPELIFNEYVLREIENNKKSLGE